MSHIPFTLAAYFFNATSVVIDKFMLTKGVPNPLVYIFYISLFSLIGLLVLPFTHIPTPVVFILASTSTVLWTCGAYFMFSAIKIGQPSRVIPVIGTLVPLFLLIEAILSHTVGSKEIIAVFLLVLGLIFLTLVDWKGRPTRAELIFEVLSSALFAFSYIALRQGYLRTDFLTVFAWSKFILIPVILAIYIVPKLRHIVLSSHGNNQTKFSLLSKMGLLFLVGQAAGGSSELLLTFSISLATPALVNSLQGTQYAFLFLFSVLLSHRFPQIFTEKLSTSIIFSKLFGIGFIAAGLFFLAK